MNFKGFKKISSDAKCTTLKHPDGHELKVAHKALSQKIKKQLNELPAMFKDGGEAEKEGAWDKFKNDLSEAGKEISDAVPSGPREVQLANYSEPEKKPYEAKAPVIEEPAEPAPAEQVSEPIPDRAPASVAEPEKPEAAGISEGWNNPPTIMQASRPVEEVPAEEQQAPVAQQAAPQAQQQTPYEKGFKDYYQEHAQKLGAEDAAWQHDLANGHVTPQTYQSLFAKKDTLGKIGTLFGLLLSGAGSGLAHQSNAVIGAMDKEIENDYNAQSQSKQNAQNYLRLHQSQQLNEANIRKTEQESKLVESQSKFQGAQADMESQAATIMKMNRAAMHNQALMVAKMPEGPQKEQAKQVLAMMGTAVDAKNANIQDLAASKMAMLGAINGGGTSGINGTALRMMGQKDLAEDVEGKTIPGLPGRAQVPLTPSDREAVNGGVEFDQKLRRFIDWTKMHSGDISPADRNTGIAMAAELQGAYRQATHGGVYKEGEQNFISKLIDSEPTKFFNNIRVVPQLEAISKENRARVNQLVKSKGFPGYQGQQSSDVKEGAKSVSKSGKPIVYKGGKWVYQQ